MSENPYQQPSAVSAPPTGGSEAARIAAPLYERRGWLKLLGIVTIVYGAFSCITIIGAIWGVPIIFIGINLFQAAAAYDDGFPHHAGRLLEASQKLATAFFIQGILALIGLVLFGLYLLFIFAMLILGVISASAQ